MFDHRHYVPILKARMGELGALSVLTDEVRSGLTPLLEIPALPWDHENDEPAKKVDQHVPGYARKINQAAMGKRVFIDLVYVDGSLFEDGRHPVGVLFREASDEGLVAVPVLGLQRSRPYMESVRDVSRQQGNGVCIRVENSDLENPGTLSNGLNDMVTFLGLQRADCDLLIDLKYVIPESRGALMFGLNSILGLLPGMDQWRTLTLAASSFPENMTNVPTLVPYEVQRVEWDMWTSLLSRGGIPRVPTFSDYGIAHPSPSSDGIDPRIMKMSANLRYTLDRTWLLLKARNVRDHGYEQFNELCRMLVARNDWFKGADFSWGDNYIHQAAINAGGPGNATTWRKVGTSHHLTLVTKQIATLLD